ncbi:MAG: hypothetical protein ACJ75B_20420 [Flavisolibacter sp.]
MTILDKIRSFLSDTTNLSLGCNEINFIQADSLDEEQIGYSIDQYGNSLVTGQDGDWHEEWLVIGADQLGDPIIVDVSSTKLTILSAAHGEGSWEPFVIADSLDAFKNIISILGNVSKERTNPVDMKKNPLTDKERQEALRRIEQQNPESEIWYWENFFESD